MTNKIETAAERASRIEMDALRFLTQHFSDYTSISLDEFFKHGDSYVAAFTRKYKPRNVEMIEHRVSVFIEHDGSVRQTNSIITSITPAD